MSLKDVDRVIGHAWHRDIKVMGLADGFMTNGPAIVLQNVQQSFQIQHNAGDGELSDYTKELISQLPRVYNQVHQRDMQFAPSPSSNWMRRY